MRRVLILGLLGLLLNISGAQISDYHIELAKEPPLKGSINRIIFLKGDLPVPGAEVRVTYRPNSATVVIERLGATDPTGAVSWIPKDAGIVTIQVTSGKIQTIKNVAVRFGRFPLGGVLIISIAGLILFGGITISFILLFKR